MIWGTFSLTHIITMALAVAMLLPIVFVYLVIVYSPTLYRHFKKKKKP